MKKFLLLTLTAILTISMVACGETETNGNDSNTAVEPTATAEVTTEATAEPTPTVAETPQPTNAPTAEERLSTLSDYTSLGWVSVGSQYEYIETELLFKTGTEFRTAGVSYDGATNTLTIENYRNEWGLLYVFMEEDVPLTIEVNGENLLQQMVVQANDIIFKGQGSLELGYMEDGVYLGDVGELSINSIDGESLANVYFNDDIKFTGPEYELYFSCPDSMNDTLSHTIAQAMGIYVENLLSYGEDTGIGVYNVGHPSKVFNLISN